MKFSKSRVKSLAIGLAWIVAMGMIAPESRAELVAGGVTRYQISPVQDLILAPGTAFNSGTEEVVLTDVAAFGFNTFDRLEVFIAGTDNLVGWSANRRLISAVPEPSSIAFLAVAALAGGCRRKKRSKAKLV